MPTDASNFTTPDNQIDPMANSTGQGQQAQAVWDPIGQRWVGKTSGGGQPMPTMQQRPSGATWDPQLKQWVPVGEGFSDGSTSMNGGAANGDATTAGRVEVNTSADGYNSGGSWGGYSGTMVRGPDGKLVLDAGMSGRQADVDRMRGLGAAAASRQAYQNDYTQANQDALMGAQMRQEQGQAIGYARDAAMGLNSQSQALGRNMLNQGAQTQQAAALSARGGGLAQMAAMRQQQGGQAAYMQQGNTALQAQLADEMAAGRAQYQQAATQQRGQDVTAQGLNQQQAISQMQNEIGQRELNQAGQMGYEGMAQNINKSAQNAALANTEMKVGVDAAASARNQRQADRDLQLVGTGASMGGALVGGLSNMARDDGGGTKKSDDDPYSRAISQSDARSKTGVRSLAAAAMARKGVR